MEIDGGREKLNMKESKKESLSPRTRLGMWTMTLRGEHANRTDVCLSVSLKSSPAPSLDVSRWKDIIEISSAPCSALSNIEFKHR